MDLAQAGTIARAIGLEEHDLRITPVAGGQMADTWLLHTASSPVFVKSAAAERAGLLSAEADGLIALATSAAVRVPRILGRGVVADRAWLALEYLDLQPRSALADARLGRQLAAMHAHTGARFGWHRNNYIGRTPQINTPGRQWSQFFAAHRLGFQFDRLAERDRSRGWPELKRAVIPAWQRTAARHAPAPSLIHGDLWHGNTAALGADEPVIFDPAVHYADRECDLAMAALFGGLGEDFFAAYQAAWPLPAGHERRRDFYQLYHLLNHVNLFGGGYADSARRLCRRVMAY